jgi:lipoprotein-anchoring transpeptidase ErfK/SrfK
LRLVFCFVLILGFAGCATPVPKIAPENLPSHLETMGVDPSPKMIVVDSKTQTLTLINNNQIEKKYTISTGKKGLGQRANTFRTPQGLHRINEKIGDKVPKNGIFHKRHFVGVWQKLPRSKHKKDFITTRIMRLEGLQPGLNKGKDWLGRTVDTETRAVYIHGTTMDWKLGSPSTKGCVHMSPDDVIKLFNEVPVGTLVWIN